jgi:hypothetical protein
MKQFKPGDEVLKVGTYRIYHYRHRMPHLANTLLVQFPQCSKCGDKVRFEEVTLDADAAGKWLRHDPDFHEPASRIEVKKNASMKRLKGFLFSMLSVCTSYLGVVISSPSQ